MPMWVYLFLIPPAVLAAVFFMNLRDAYRAHHLLDESGKVKGRPYHLHLHEADKSSAE